MNHVNIAKFISADMKLKEMFDSNNVQESHLAQAQQ
jgi:hypothetical protein